MSSEQIYGLDPNVKHDEAAIKAEIRRISETPRLAIMHPIDTCPCLACQHVREYEAGLTSFPARVR